MATRIKIFAIQAGGLFGPLAGGLVSPILPELSGSFDRNVEAVSLSLSAYFIPFAVLLVVSGTVGERIGRRTTVIVAYQLFIVGLLLAAIAPNLMLFIVARGLQGVANAFTTPLLLAGLADIVPRGERGKSLGVFASFQAAGQALSALLAGSMALWNWRWAFVVVAGVALFASLFPPAGSRRSRDAELRLRRLLSRGVVLCCAAGFCVFLGAAGLAFLVALVADSRFLLGPFWTGVLLTLFAVPGLFFGKWFGMSLDRLGRLRLDFFSIVGTAACILVIGISYSVWVSGVAWLVCGGLVTVFNIGLQNETLLLAPKNAGGATSLVSAFRFCGSAIAPILWTPLFRVAPVWAFGCAALVTLFGAGAYFFVPRRGFVEGVPSGSS
jgi:predicted MFS family arabinose efflux permease